MQDTHLQAVFGWPYSTRNIRIKHSVSDTKYWILATEKKKIVRQNT